MPADALIDLARIDPSKVVADIEAIHKANPQRFEMEQLTRIVHAEDALGEIGRASCRERV